MAAMKGSCPILILFRFLAEPPGSRSRDKREERDGANRCCPSPNGRLQPTLQVLVDALVDLFDQRPQPVRTEVAAPMVHRSELTPVDRDQLTSEQLQLLRLNRQLPACPTDCFEVVPTEIGDGLEVRREPPQKPHHLD